MTSSVPLSAPASRDALRRVHGGAAALESIESASRLGRLGVACGIAARRQSGGRIRPLLVLIAAAALAGPGAAAANRDIAPANDSFVLEKLPPRVALRATTPQQAASAARRWIGEARELAEPRYLGRAQAVLAPWWDRPEAPAELAVLQATIEQSRHEFAAARATLERTLARSDTNAQGWLTLATLDRVAGRYQDAQAACDKVAATGAPLYAQACRLETRSLLGFHDQARTGFSTLLQASIDAGVRAWLSSLAGENEERAGNDAAAAADYRASLALVPDDYTALALADLLLRTGDPAAALAVLAERPASDAVQLRRAAARKRLGDDGWQRVATDLRERFAALAERGDDPALHAREAALFSLWIDPDARQAWAAAQANLTLQKEPLDWWIALTAASAAEQPAELARLVQALRATGMVDARLAGWL